MAQNNRTLELNGYSYADIKATFDGIELPGLTNIDLQVEQLKENIYGVGSQPVGRSRGNITYSGSLEMDMDTIQRLRALSPDGTLVQVPQGVFIITLKRGSDNRKVVITCSAFEFNQDGISGSQGDASLTRSIDVIFAGYLVRIL